jgi:hypothetical protein
VAAAIDWCRSASALSRRQTPSPESRQKAKAIERKGTHLLSGALKRTNKETERRRATEMRWAEGCQTQLTSVQVSNPIQTGGPFELITGFREGPNWRKNDVARPSDVQARMEGKQL